MIIIIVRLTRVLLNQLIQFKLLIYPFLPTFVIHELRDRWYEFNTYDIMKSKTKQLYQIIIYTSKLIIIYIIELRTDEKTLVHSFGHSFKKVYYFYECITTIWDYRGNKYIRMVRYRCVYVCIPTSQNIIVWFT